MRRVLAALGLVLGAASVPAHGLAAPGAVPLGHVWDFTLPTLDGSRFVQASRLHGPVLVNFWGKDCAPCLAELPRLEAFARAHPDWTVLLISTDAPAQAREFVQRHGLQLPVLRPGAHVGALMRSAGNPQGGLPFTVALRADAQTARLCAGQRGELAPAHLAAFATACGREGGL